MERTGGGKDDINPQTFSSEGVEGYIPFTGPLEYVLQGYSNGIKSGMSYSGAYTLKVLPLIYLVNEPKSQVRARNLIRFQIISRPRHPPNLIVTTYISIM
jgi:hypothetical protein